MKKIYTFFLLLCLLQFNVQFAQISLQWAVGAGSSGDDLPKKMVTDRAGNAYCTGNFYSNIDLDPGPGTFTLAAGGGTDIFIAKTNSAGSFVWAKHIGGTANEFVESIYQDLQNNVYITGWFDGSADFDPGAGTFTMGSTGITDAFICKLDKDGNFIWAKQFSGNNEVSARDLVTDENGGVYVTGSFKLIADLDPGASTYTLSSAGNYDAYICKLSANGNFVWAKRIGQSGWDEGSALEFSSAHVFISGQFSNVCDLDPGLGSFPVSSNGGKDMFLIKLDTLGVFKWGGSMGGAFGDNCQDLTTDTLGNIYATGYFEAISDFDPGLGSYSLSAVGSEDIFIMKIDPLGVFLWARAMGGPSQDNGRGIAVANGNVYTVGMFSETADLNPNENYEFNLTSSGNAEIFMSQLDEFGNFITVAAMGGPGSDVAMSVDVDSTGGVYMYGAFGGYSTQPADFDPGAATYTLASNNATYDIFLAKYKPSAKNVSVATLPANPVSFALFPSPAADVLIVRSPETILSLDIVNLQGKLVKHFSGLSLYVEVDVSDQPSGVYMVNVQMPSRTVKQKILKE
jgi:hypothetical protein